MDFKYSSLFIVIYLFYVSIPLISMIINKKDIENNLVFFLFVYIIVPLFAVTLEYCINVWFINN